MMTWFKTLTGFSEQSMDQVRANLRLDGTTLSSLVNQRSFEAGTFTTPSLATLRKEIERPAETPRRIRLSQIAADIRSLHQDVAYQNATFQVASQFNCLEMASPSITPEQGVGIYQSDLTQGPACSICAGAGTIVRNYFVETNGRIGQSHDNQIDCLAEIADHFGNQHNSLWTMQNGYCFPSATGLAQIEQQLAESDPVAIDQIRGKLQVGLHANTQVTIGESEHLVTQVFCSALPVAYSRLSKSDWNYFPKLILESTYESTFYAALRNLRDSGSDELFLTLVGGGVFGNRLEWILSAIARSLSIFTAVPLDVRIVSYGGLNPDVEAFVSRWRESATGG